MNVEELDAMIAKIKADLRETQQYMIDRWAKEDAELWAMRPSVRTLQERQRCLIRLAEPFIDQICKLEGLGIRPIYMEQDDRKVGA